MLCELFILDIIKFLKILGSLPNWTIPTIALFLGCQHQARYEEYCLQGSSLCEQWELQRDQAHMDKHENTSSENVKLSLSMKSFIISITEK